MPEYPESNLCPTCGGDGLDGSEFCILCSGSGYVSTLGAGLHRKLVSLALNSIETKIDAIAVQVQALYDDLNP